MLGAALLAVAGATACGGSDRSHTSSARRIASARPPRCTGSERFGHVAHNPWAHARERLAPAGSGPIRLCRYAGVTRSPGDRLVRSRLVSEPALVTRLVGQFNDLPPFPPGTYACPADDGSQILALLAYPDGKRVTVAFDLTGCRGVTNGDLVRSAFGYGPHPDLGPKLLTELEQLVE